VSLLKQEWNSPLRISAAGSRVLLLGHYFT
jgi:hypothetical protein